MDRWTDIRHEPTTTKMWQRHRLSSNNPRKVALSLSLIVIIFIHLLGYYAFFCGFLPNNASKQTSTATLTSDIFHDIDADKKLKLQIKTQRFNRLVFILIDALRADFVFDLKNDYMPFLKEKLHENASNSFISIADTPTVTMPRIKGITSGSIPSFYEILANSMSKEHTEDNIIKQFSENNFTMVFYGDDTWIKLYPETFKQSDGTSSFYVNDYTEVDNNVTRHLDHDFASNDWDVMILHYLGLDHIGHTAGPYSPLIREKLLEMDKIIENIYTKVTQFDNSRSQKTLLFITGDHGMSNAGSHGGASKEELNTPIIFLSSSMKGNTFIGKTVKQTDIASTLSVLFGLEIPYHNIGRPIIPFLDVLYTSNEIQLINQKIACQLYKIVSLKFISASELELLKDLCLGHHTNPEIIDVVSKSLHANSSEYQSHFMILGIVLMTMSTLWMLYFLKEYIEFSISQVNTGQAINTFSILWMFIVSASMLSSSFVEEEQYIYYYFFPSYLILLVMSNREMFHSVFILLVLQRIMRAWNRTGVKWIGLKDINDYLNENKEILIMSMALGFGFGMWNFKRHFKDLLPILLWPLILWYKACSVPLLPAVICTKTSQLIIPRIILLVLIIYSLLCKRDSYSIKLFWMCITFLLLRPTNLLWFCLVVIAEQLIATHIVSKLAKKNYIIQMFFLYTGLSRFCYFAQGNSNNFSTVDIAAGMIGLSEFHPFWSIFFSFLATYCTKFYWYISLILNLWENNERLLMKQFGYLLCGYQMLEASLCCIVVFIMRYHLFIWSVFAPKYFYLMVQSVLNILVFTPMFIFSSYI